MSLAQSIFLDRVPFTLSYDYIIYTDGTNVYAFNTKTKAIEKIGTPEDVFNYVSNILNQNGGSVFVKKVGDIPYRFNIQGIYINTHKKVEWISDGAILQHNILNIETITGNNLFWLDVSGYTDCQITIKGFVIQDIRTNQNVPMNNSAYFNAGFDEANNRIIAVNWGIDFSTQTYNGRRIVIENNVIMPTTIIANNQPVGSTVLWTNPDSQFIEFRNNLIVGRVGDCVHFDYAGDFIVEGNIIFNTVQLDNTWGNSPVGIYIWQSDGNIDIYQGSNVVIKRNKLYNCIITLNNPTGVLVEGNYITWLPNAINQSNPFPNVNQMPSIHVYRTVNNAKNYLNTQIINNYIICLITQYWRPAGIRVDGNGTSNDITIAYNTIINVYNNISFYFNVTSNNDENSEVFSRVRIIGNKVYGGNSGLIGIADLSGSTTNKIRNVEISDNIISSFYSPYGLIGLSGNFENLIIRNNICWDFYSTTAYTYQLVNHSSGSMKNAIIEGNVFNPTSPIDPSNPIIQITNPTVGTVKAINNVNYNPRPVASITVGASPFVYQNTDPYPEDIIISGGTVSSIAWSRDGSTYYNLGLTSGRFHLEPGEYLQVTYTAAPTMTKVPL